MAQRASPPSTHVGRSQISDVLSYWTRTVVNLTEVGEYPDPHDSNAAEKKTTLDMYAILIAGGVAGAVSRTLTAPLDRLKILMQLQVRGANSAL